MAGITVGAILGSVLIGLVGYFIYAMKRPESFSHRWLYDDTRSDPGKEEYKCFAQEHL